jgi:hypothetical protein
VRSPLPATTTRTIGACRYRSAAGPAYPTTARATPSTSTSRGAAPRIRTRADLWAWEHIYHQFGLTRPLHRDRGGKPKMQESWHIEETGKELAEESANE